MSLSINNVRGVLSSVSFDNETSNKKAAVDTFEMVRGSSYLKSHKSASATGKAGKCSSSDCKEAPAAATQTQNQAQAESKVSDAKDEAQVQSQSQAQAVGKEEQAQADAKAKGY